MTKERAKQLIQWMHWENGMCGCRNAVRPEGNPETPEEKRWLKDQMDVHLGGVSCTAYLLYAIKNGTLIQAVRITWLGTNGADNQVKIYTRRPPEGLDRIIFDLVIEHKDVITMGKGIGEPIYDE